MPGSLSGASPERPRLVETPVHRSSRRQLGLSPEFTGLPSDVPGQPTRQPHVMTAPQVTLHQPRTPNAFHGDAFEDVDDWIAHFERVASFNQWDDVAKRRNVCFALEDGALTWYENHEASLATWNDIREQLQETFSSTDRRDQALRLLESRIQKPNESVVMFAEDLARLFRRADPAMPEPKKLRYLMHGVKEQLFAGLVRNPPRTVQEFIKEATAIERAVQERSRQYARMATSAPGNAASLTSDDSSLRELIRSVLREELSKLGIAPPQPAPSLSRIVREELHQALSPPDPPAQEIPASYAAALRQQTSVRPTPPFHQELPPVQSWPMPERVLTRTPVRKTDMWRTADRRPLCYHCGEPGHIYRRCPYRDIGLRGFPPSAPRPRLGQRPVEIADYLAARNTTNTPSFTRRSRSPSPATDFSPTRRAPRDRPEVRFSSPRRGN